MLCCFNPCRLLSSVVSSRNVPNFAPLSCCHIFLLYVTYFSVYQTQWAADYFEIKDNAMAYATKMSASGLEMVLARLADLLGIAQSGITQWNPDIVDFGYSLTLPFRMVDLQSMPQLTIDVAKHVAELKNWASSYIPLAPPGDDWTMADMYYMYKPSADVINWVPPFAGL